MSEPNKKPTLLCVANWDSNVGYAWWLMESFWVKIHAEFSTDFQVAIAYPSISTLPHEIKDAKIPTIEFDFYTKKIADVLANINFIKANKVAIIYFSDRPTIHWSYLFFRLAGVKKIIVHDHTPGMRSQPSGVRKLIKSFLGRIPYLTVDCAIGATEYVKNRLINVNCLPAKKCYAVPNGLPELETESISSLNLHQQLNIEADALLIVGTGRANVYKGIDFALHVIAQLVHKNKITGIHFIYCGDGPDLDLLKEMSRKLNIASHVSFLGKVNNIQLVLAACDIAFHPSRGEVGYSLSILEYMRAGLPVVLSNNPSVSEATIHRVNGLIYQEDNIEDSAQLFIELLNDRCLQKYLGEQAKKTVAERYSIKITHDRLISTLTPYIIK